MFRLESNRLKREFKITDGNFYASQILNTYSGMSLVPDGNGNEFVVRFVDGSDFSSKSVPVIESEWVGNKLRFVYAEYLGLSVTVEYWVHEDKNTICKQLTLNQSNSNPIDFVVLDNIGIINSKTHFSVGVMDDSEIAGVHASLGQPFYIDSLFFGCEFPATDNRITHGAGRVKYYLGKAVGKAYKCPITVMGAGRDNTIPEVKKAFFEYIDFISTDIDLKFQYNSWFDYKYDINEQNIVSSFTEISKQLQKHNAPKLDTFVVDDGWMDMKASFWTYNKKFPNGLSNVADECKKLGSGLGLWLGPRGGYCSQDKIAKRFQRGGNGYYNKEGKEICVASSMYVDKLTQFFVEQTKSLDLDYWKLDGFCYSPCKNEAHDHMVGGKDNMYFVSDMWHKWIKAFETLRTAKPNIWINMTCYVNVSPWWLQWVNSIWLQNSLDIGFAENYEEQPQVESEITYRDGRYFDCVCRRANQIPLKAVYNHEPIYAQKADVDYTDEDFEKFIYWCAVRGQALNELYISSSIMSDRKWQALADVMNFQKNNYHILKNASFIGGDPADNNIYGYISWTQEGEGIIALRNPTKDKTSLTLTLNKLMGAPESLSGVRRYNVYNKSMPETEETFSYNDKIDLTMHAFEIMIFKFSK